MSGVRVEVVGDGWERSADVDGLLYDVLYRGFGVAPDGPWRVAAGRSTLAVALSPDARLLGAARLMSGGGALRQLRQLAVYPAVERQGVGRALVEALEALAAGEGATGVWLNARDSAFAFYEALGYRFAGPVFVSELTGIPHRRMERAL